MKKLISMLLVPVLAGCLTSSPLEIVDWSIGFVDRGECCRTAYGAVRLLQVVVNAPYDVREFAVLRADGSIARDPYNRFAALPAQLLKGPIIEAFMASKKFSQVVGSSSAAKSEIAAEVTITRLAFDCRKESHEALVELRIKLLNRNREIIAMSAGAGTAKIERDYSVAFSEAFTTAITSALKAL